ncbi:MAG: KTSC domain-containing protein [Candidatus Dadabacteria bacterium]
MIRIPVQSQIIKSVGYDLKTSTLEVELAGKEHIRQYPQCPQHLFIEMIQAQSIGKFYLKQIKGQLKQIKVGAEEEEYWS